MPWVAACAPGADENRGVRQNRKRRPPALRFVHKPPHGANQRRQRFSTSVIPTTETSELIRDDLDARARICGPPIRKSPRPALLSTVASRAAYRSPEASPAEEGAVLRHVGIAQESVAGR